MHTTFLSSHPAVTRRHFVKTLAGASLAAFAAPCIVPAGVIRAQDGRPVPSNRTTFALIGCGNMGPAGMANILNDKTAQVIGTCDVFKDRAEHHCNEVNKFYRGEKAIGSWVSASGTYKGEKVTGNVCTAYQDFRKLLERKDLDCVEIATGDYWHVPLAIYAVRAGKDVYVEKPLGVAVNWAKVLRKEINDRKAVFQFGTWQRSRPHYRRVAELVRSGALGKISRVNIWAPSLAAMDNRSLGGIFDPKSQIRKLHLNTQTPPVPAGLDYDLWLGPAPAKPYNPVRVSPQGIYHGRDYAVGFIGGWGIHPLDIALWGLDADLAAPVTYEGTGRLPDVPGLFNTVATWDMNCTYPNGVQLRFMDASVGVPVVEKENLTPTGSEGCTFFGENGWISVNRGKARGSTPELTNRIYADKLRTPDNEVHLHAAENNNHWHNFIARVKDRKPTLNPIESAFTSDAICHLTDIAVRTGRKLTWDTKTETIIGDTEANKFLDRELRAPWKL